LPEQNIFIKIFIRLLAARQNFTMLFFVMTSDHFMITAVQK